MTTNAALFCACAKIFLTRRPFDDAAEKYSRVTFKNYLCFLQRIRKRLELNSFVLVCSIFWMTIIYSPSHEIILLDAPAKVLNYKNLPHFPPWTARRRVIWLHNILYCMWYCVQCTLYNILYGKIIKTLLFSYC